MPTIYEKIRNKILDVPDTEGVGGLAVGIYLQQIRDAVLEVVSERYGNLADGVYLQQIRNAILGFPDGKYGNLADEVYLQQIRDAFLGTSSIPGKLDENIYLKEIYDSVPVVSIPPTPPTPPPVNVIVNGTFDANSDWTKPSNSTIAGGKLVCTNSTGDLITAIPPMAVNKSYTVKMTITVTGGFVYFTVGNDGSFLSESGTYEDVISIGVHEFDGGNLYITAEGFSGTIDDVEAYEI
jgi:hypothetical protein